MNLGKKIYISLIIIAVLPVALMFCSIAIIGSFQISAIENKYDIEINSFDKLYNSIELLDQITENACEKIQEIKENEPEKLEDVAYLEELNKSLIEKYTFIIVYKNNNVVFNGSGEEVDNLDRFIPTNEDDINEAIYVSGATQYLVKSEGIEYNDGEEGMVIVVSMVNNSLPEIRTMIIIFIFVLVIITIFTAICLTVWIYKSIIRPVKDLKKAANNISEGNLDFKITQYKDSEFGELSEAFEEMRVHLKESIEANIQNEAESKELISNISHDLKTPITAIKGYVEGIMDGVADTPEKMEKYIRTIYNKANDMDKLIGELTIYSKIDSNKIPYNFAKLNLEDYFDDCVDEIKIDLSARNIKLTYIDYVDKDVLVIADPEQLKRVINNVISNAVKYMDKEEKFIAIRLYDEDDFVHVEIEDNGKGIANDEIQYIFERFYRTDSSRNSKQGGSGIGLAISKKIMEAHGGRIWATSKLGSGTTIHFILRKIV